jgi:putative phosphoribosyl transferase
MYFKSRADAGRALANKLGKYDQELTAIVALSPGAVLVGAQIAMRIHASLLLLIMEKVNLPGEPVPIASMTNKTFTYNNFYSAGELEEYKGEYNGIIQQQRIEKQHALNRLVTDDAEIDPIQLKDHTVILVSDGLQNGMALDVANDFLKPIQIKRLVIATPLATVEAVDKMHLLADEIFCLSVAQDMMEVDHYYDDNTIPEQEGLMKVIHNISLNWQI